MTVQDLPGRILVPIEYQDISLQHTCLGAERTRASIHIDVALVTSILCLLHQIRRRGISVKSQEHRRATLKDLIGKALVESVAARFDGWAYRHSAPKDSIPLRTAHRAGDKGIDGKTPRILLNQIFFIPAETVPDHKEELARIPLPKEFIDDPFPRFADACGVTVVVETAAGQD